MTLANFDYPGVRVTEAIRGAIPAELLGFQTALMIGTALRGPVDQATLITKIGQYYDIFGPRTTSSWLDDAVKAWFENVDAGNAPAYVVRAIGAGAVKASVILIEEGADAQWTLTLNCTTVVLHYGGQDTAALTSATLTAAALQTALQGLSSIGAGNATVTGATGGPFTIKLAGALSHTVATALTATPTGGGATATVSAVDPGAVDVDVLQFDAWGPGADYNYAASPAHGVSVQIAAGTLTVYDAGQAIEVFHDVTASNAQLAVQQINGRSNVIRATWLDTTRDPSDMDAPSGLAGGSDGASVTNSTIIGAVNGNTSTGLQVFRDAQLPLGFLMAPGYSAQAVGLELIDIAESFRHLAIIDSSLGLSVQQAFSERNTFAASMGHGLYCYGWVEVLDVDTNTTKYVPRSPFRAAHIARSHSLPGGLANVGAGLDFRLRGALSLETDDLMDDATHGELNRRGIDVARNFAAFGQGIVHFAARTIATNILYRFLQVRVIFNVLAKSIELGLRPYVFKPIDGSGRLANEIKGTLDQMLWQLWTDGALFGRDPSDAFFTKVDISNREQLEEGILGIEVYAKPTPIAERLNVLLFRVPLAFDFRTGEVKVGSIETQ